MRLRDGQLRSAAQMADPLLRGVDALRTLLRGLPESQGEAASVLIAQPRGPARGSRARVADGDDFARACGGAAPQGPPRGARDAARAQARARRSCSRSSRASARSCREPGAKPRTAVVGSALEPDLLAEALGSTSRSSSSCPSPSTARSTSSRWPTRARPLPLYFGQIAVDLGFITDAQRRDVLRAQRTSLLRRSFSETAVVARLPERRAGRGDRGRAGERLADAELPAHPFEDEEIEPGGQAAAVVKAHHAACCPSTTRSRRARSAPTRSASRSRCSTS